MIARRLDSYGRILLPKSVRQVLNVEKGDKVGLDVKNNKVSIVPLNKVIKCKECGTETKTLSNFCKNCGSSLKDQE